MSSTQHQVMMESSLAVLGRLELTPSSPTAVGVSRGPLQLSSGGGGPPPANEKNGQPPPPPPGSHLNGCVPLSHQVAGHKFGVDTVGILQHPDGTVLKQLQPPPRGPREMQFYSMVYAEDCCDPCLLELQNHLPKYYGTWSSPDSPKDLYLKLEDVTRRFIKPCIMDVKLGQRSYDPFASQEKRTDQIRKYPLMEEIGFLVLGMRVYKVCSDSFDSYDQHYGRGLVKDTIKDGLSKFFHNGAGLRKDAVSASIRRVRHILRWFESQRQLVFYASSLLFVYEGFTSSSSPTSSSSTSPSSSSPPSSLSSTPLISPPTEKPASTEVGGDDDGKGRRGHAAGQEEGADVTEYNNNNICVAVPLDYSLATMYANHRRGGHHHHYCAKGQFHGNGDSTTKTSGPVTNVIAPSSEEDNSPWKHMAGRRPQPNGNGIRSQLESEEEEEEQEGRREGEAERRATRRDTSKQKRDGGNGGEEEEVEVRMIDFAHVFSSDSHDRGYVYGLKHLLAVLEQILHESS